MISSETPTSLEPRESCDELMDECLRSAAHVHSVPVPATALPQRRGRTGSVSPVRKQRTPVRDRRPMNAVSGTIATAHKPR